MAHVLPGLDGGKSSFRKEGGVRELRGTKGGPWPSRLATPKATLFIVSMRAVDMVLKTFVDY